MVLRERIFQVTPDSFGETALAVFRYQAEHCAVYREYLSLLGMRTEEVARWEQIPYLPVAFFKTRRIYSDAVQYAEPEVVFTSSGTTGDQTSRHEVADVGLYEESFMRGFAYFYGEPKDWSVFALLPGYMERTGSSLVYMVERLHAQNPNRGGFYLRQYDRLLEALKIAVGNGEKILLIGVAFALLDFAEYLEKCDTTLPYLSLAENAVVMETGGMKGRRREVDRGEMHEVLKKTFGVPAIHSEYGMTELLSQAYSDGNGVFRCPPWMRMSLRDMQNPLEMINETDRQGGINVIDLANLYSCSFLAIQDRGVMVDNESGFKVLGRLKGAQVRGCNMLVE